MLPLNLTGLDVVVAAGAEFTASVAPPPYFGNSLPLMPVVNFYDKFMEPGALPLQYINYPVDEYIPTTYTATSFANSGDLAQLYENVAEFFSEPTESPTPNPATTNPTPAPMADPTTAPAGQVPTTPIANPTSAPQESTDPPTGSSSSSPPSYGTMWAVLLVAIEIALTMA